MDPDTFEDSWRQHASGVRKLVRELLGDATAADDVVQQTWLTALRRPPVPMWRLGAWLAGVARNHARDQLRGEQRRRARERRVARAESDASSESASEGLDQLEQIELVVEAVRQLSVRNREIVLLRYYEDLPPAVIAERLALPVATVKTRLRRSLEELRRRLEGRVFPAWTWLGGATVTLKAKASVIALVAALLLFTGVLWFASRGLETREVNSVAERSDGALAEATPPTPLTSTTRTTTPDVALESDGAAVETSPQQPASVRVVLRATGAPVPGAVVTYVPPDRWPNDPIAMERRMFTHVDPETEFAPFAERLVADERGEVRLPEEQPIRWIHARSGALFGRAMMDTTSALPLLLELGPEQVANLRVLDEDGHPRAGVAVGLRMLHGDNLGDCFVTGTTRARDGVFELRHLETFAFYWQRRTARIAASLAIPLREPVLREFDPAAQDAHTIELELPPTGRVRIRAVDELGQNFAAPALIGITAQALNPEDPGFVRGPQWVEIAEGVADFPCVGLGLDLVAYLRVLGQTHELASLRFDGPTRAGETIDVDLRVGARTFAVTGTFIDENGAPLRDLYVRAHPSEAVGRPKFFHPKHLRIGADGRFRIDFDEAALRTIDLPWQLVSTTRPNGTDPGRLWSGTLDLRGRDPRPGDHEIGEVLLRSSPPLASGVIVGANDAPMPASLRVEHRDPSRSNAPWSSPYFTPEVVMHRSGAFALYGACPPGELRLIAHREGFLSSAPVPFARGEENLRLVMQTAAAIEGRVLLDPSVSPQTLQVRVTGSAVAPGPLHPGIAALDAKGRFRIGDLRAGRVAFRICAAPSDANVPPASADVFRIDELELEAGEVCADERVREIDLRGLVHCLRLHVADPEGAPLSGVDVALRASGRSDQAWRRVKTATDGSASFATRDLPLELHLGKKGYCMLELTTVDGDRRVVLDRGVPCIVVLDEAWQAARELGQLELAVHGPEQRHFPASMSREEMAHIFATQRRTLGLPDPLPIGSDLRYEVVIPGPGEYKLELLLSVPTSSGGDRFPTSLAIQRISLAAGPTPSEPWHFRFSAERLNLVRQVVERVKERGK